MKWNNIVWMAAGILIFCLCIVPVDATCTFLADDYSPDLGNAVTFYGTCDAGETAVYMFMVGPNMPASGANMNTLDLPHNPVVDGDPATFLSAPVSGGTWSVTWPTQGRILDAGTYTVYGETAPEIPPASWATISLIMTRAAGTGEISIASTPAGAHLVFDGESTGFHTPCQYSQISGTHTVTLYNPGYALVTASETIPAGSTTPVSYPLSQVPETLSKIAWSSNRHYVAPFYDFEIFVMDTDGSNVVDLTNSADESEDEYPAGSPDGTRIAFTSSRNGGDQNIWVMDTDGSNQRRLTAQLANEARPAWSPDGTKITFASSRLAQYEIYTIDADGSNTIRLTNDPGYDSWPAWSPDGSRIAFESTRLGGDSNIWTMDPDGSNLLRLTFTPGFDNQYPAWSPDGTKIAFMSDRDGNDEIYSMDTDGTNVIRLTTNAGSDIEPAWSLDSTKIAFVSDRDGDPDIYVMDADGSNLIQLTNDPGIDVMPAWFPTGLDLPVREAVQDVIDTELGGVTTGVEVSAYAHIVPPQPTITTWDDSHQFATITGDCSLVAIDRAPKANYGHLITYIAMQPDGTREKIDRYTPVTNYAFQHDSGIKADAGENLDPADPVVWHPTACTLNCDNRYALLIDATHDADTNYRRYWNDISAMYIALTEAGYRPSNIRVLMSDGGAGSQDQCVAISGQTCTKKVVSSTDLNGDGQLNEAAAGIIGGASRAEIISTLDTWGASLPADANLTVFVTGHGGWDALPNAFPNGHSVWIYTWGGTRPNDRMTDAELTNELAGTPAKNIILIMENCFSGGFKGEFTPAASLPNGKTRTLITAALGNESSWGSGFSNAWIQGIAGHTRSGVLDLGADTNPQDQLVSMKESLDYVYTGSPTKDPYATTSITGMTAGKEHPGIYYSGSADNTGSAFLNNCPTGSSKSITVTDPNPLTPAWYAGDSQQVTWNQAGYTQSDHFTIRLLRGTAVCATYLNIDAVPQYKRIVLTDYLPAADTYRIRITAADGTSADSAVFSINGQLASNTGSMTVSTYDGATGAAITGAAIYLDGSSSSSGTTPRTFASVRQGWHELKTTKALYYDGQGFVQISAGQPSSVPIKMEKIPVDPNDYEPFGGIDVTSTPTGADVWVTTTDGTLLKDSGLATQAQFDLPPGTYKVTVKKLGYKTPAPRTVIVDIPFPLREPVPVHFDLEPESWLYTFDGFFDPVDMSTVNLAKAGQSIPMKWHLANKDGLDVSRLTGDFRFVQEPVSCTAIDSPTDVIDVYAAPGSSGLQYLGGGNWQYNWKTDKSWAGKCRLVHVEYMHGQASPVATFRFTK